MLEKDCKRLEQLGLSLADSKDILGTLQQHVLERQAAAFVDERRCCPGCGRRLGLKGRHNITFRTLFGDIALDSPRLRRCRCSPEDTATFSPLTELLAEHTSPELMYLQTKWSSLISYGMTAKMLKDVLPVDEKLNAATVRNHALEIARRSENDLRQEQLFDSAFEQPIAELAQNREVESWIGKFQPESILPVNPGAYGVCCLTVREVL